VSDALSRSWKLVNSQWWNTFIINILGIVLIWAISLLMSIPAIITGVSTNIFSTAEFGATEYPQWYWIVQGLSVVISTLFLVVPLTFHAFQYFNLNEYENPTIDLSPNNEEV
jgi:hypothetical protein